MQSPAPLQTNSISPKLIAGGWLLNIAPLAHQTPSTQAMTASQRTTEMLCGLWEQLPAGVQPSAIAFLHHTSWVAPQTSPPCYGREGGSRFILCATEKHQPHQHITFPTSYNHSQPPPLCPRLICHYSSPQSIQAPTPKQCIKCQFKGIKYSIWKRIIKWNCRSPWDQTV